MYRIVIFLFVAFATGCVPTRDEGPSSGSPIHPSSATHPPGAASAGTKELVGDQAIADLRRWYQDTRSDCGGATAPAFLCTGIMLRATTSGDFLPWNPNPASTGVSFSWLRADTNFADLVFNYRNGFVFYPKNEGVAGTGIINVLCVFPMDSDTSSREDSGCGVHPSVGASSRPCNEQGINDGAAWASHFNALPTGNKYIGQCGWNVRAGQPSTSDRFRAFVQGRSRMPSQWWAIQNEVRMASWAQNSQVPIRAFFYENGDETARGNARNDQIRYQSTFGTFAPIVRLTLPVSQGGQATFAYMTADQAVPDPGAGPGPGPGEYLVTFESTPVQKVPFYPPLIFHEDTPQGPISGELGYLDVSDASVSGMVGHHLVITDFYGYIVPYDPSAPGQTLLLREISFTLRVPAGYTADILYVCTSDPLKPILRHDGSGEVHVACAQGKISSFKIRSMQGKGAMDNVRFKP